MALLNMESCWNELMLNNAASERLGLLMDLVPIQLTSHRADTHYTLWSSFSICVTVLLLSMSMLCRIMVTLPLPEHFIYHYSHIHLYWTSLTISEVVCPHLTWTRRIWVWSSWRSPARACCRPAPRGRRGARRTRPPGGCRRRSASWRACPRCGCCRDRGRGWRTRICPC